MKQTKAPSKTSPTPSPQPGETTSSSAVGTTDNPTSVFIGMALDMSWRLAVAVLVPIIGGFELDQHFKTGPWLTVAGFVLAMGGMYIVLKTMLQAVNQAATPVKGGRP